MRFKKVKCCNSFGLILVTIHPITKELYVIVTERSHSYAFVEFLRGKFVLTPSERHHNKTDLETIFSRMTIKERTLLKESNNFESMYRSVFLYSKKQNLMHESIHRYKYVDVKKHIGSTESKYENCEIGFPKGRKNKNESYLDAAVRETWEETAILPHEYDVIRGENTITETHFASNSVRYKSTYFVAKMKEFRTEFPLGHKQLEESRRVFSIPLRELTTYFRDYERHKFETVEQLEKLLASLSF